MKYEIRSLLQLRDFLNTLTEQQLQQPSTKVMGPHDTCNLFEAEVNDHEFLVSKEDSSEVGYENEIRAMLDLNNLPFKKDEWEVLEPKGHVQFYGE